MAAIFKKKSVVRKIEFSLSAPQARSVSIAGDFDQWNTSSHSLKHDKKGVWRGLLSLNRGQYEYRFFVDGGWQNDPSCCSFILTHYTIGQRHEYGPGGQAALQGSAIAGGPFRTI